jgi:hypothetical protein
MSAASACRWRRNITKARSEDTTIASSAVYSALTESQLTLRNKASQMTP